MAEKHPLDQIDSDLEGLDRDGTLQGQNAQKHLEAAGDSVREIGDTVIALISVITDLTYHVRELEERIKVLEFREVSNG